MNIIELLAMAVALALDALAVAVATGLSLRCTLGQTMRMSLAFGGFQFIMPVLGWLLGLSVRGYIESFDHWVAFALLALVGLNMIRGAFSGGQEECRDPTRGLTLLVLAVATSIDALAVGLSLAVLKVDIWYPAAVIGLVCFCITAMGMHLGKVVISASSTLASKANFIGGCVLIGIGVKILWEHGVFA